MAFDPLPDAQSAKAAGLNPERLARIGPFLEARYLAPGRLKGCLTLVWRRGRLAYFSAQGQMDAERGRPMRADTLFRIYSMTKPLTCLAFMMLVEEGRVALDEPVSRYIPAWADLQVYDGGELGGFRTRPPAQPMQIVDLLRHTSGLTYGFHQQNAVDAAYRALEVGEVALSGTLEGLVQALAGLPLLFSPGEAWNYSVSTDVLGYLIGAISGQPFEEFLHQRLTGPLGMADTGFSVAEGQGQRLAACYRLEAADRVTLQDDPATSAYLAAPAFASGGGGLISTAADYLSFCRLLLGRGALDGVRYVSPKTLDLMAANHLPGGADLAGCAARSQFSEASYAGVGFGLGLATTIAPPTTLIPGSAGDLFWGGMASTYFWVDPAEDLAVVFMTQLIPSSAYAVRRELRTLVYAAIEETGASRGG